MEDSISLNKFISDTGYCSRREADNLIAAGRVMLNDKVAVTGNRYSPGDVVEVDGSYITPDNKEKRVYLALNKPMGITSTTELQVKGNIITFVGYPKRIFPIGRLDKDSEGLIFLTNDGDIINKILRAGNSHEKEYIVRVNKPVDAHFLQKMSGGLPIMGTMTLPCKVQQINRQTFRIILTQGLNRQIRRMVEFLGYSVVGLQRVRIMNIKLGNLPIGKWRNLSEAEVDMLKNAVADSSPAAAKSKKNTRTEYIPRKKAKPSSDGNGDALSNKKETFHKEKPAPAGSKPKTDKPKVEREKGRLSFWDKRSRPGKRKSGFKDAASGSGTDKPAFRDSKSDHKKDKPAFRDNKSDSKKDKPAFRNNKSEYKKDKPEFSSKKSGPGKDSAGFRDKKSGAAKDKPGFRDKRSGVAKDKQSSSKHKPVGRQQSKSNNKNKGRAGGRSGR